jgi:hypothetical protein
MGLKEDIIGAIENNTIGYIKELFNDTVAAAKAVYSNPSEENVFELALCIVGWIPGPGAGLKVGLRAVARNPALLFDVARIIMKHRLINAPGEPEQWLDKILGEHYIRNAIENGKRAAIKLANKRQFDLSWIQGRWMPNGWNKGVQSAADGATSMATGAAGAAITWAFDFAYARLDMIVRVLAKKLKLWKPRVPKTSHVVYSQPPKAAKPPAKKTANNTPTSSKPTANKTTAKTQKTSQKSKTAETKTYPKQQDETAKNGKPDTDDPKTSQSSNGILSGINNAITGVIGEHMGDYWVAKELGIHVNHDDGETPSRKLDGAMTKINDGPRGTGLDSLWETNGARLGGLPSKQYTYAVYEYKASRTKDDKTLGSTLGKNTPKKKTPAAGKDNKRTQGDKIDGTEDAQYQMDEAWVNQRLKQTGHDDKKGQTSRHVLFFGASAIAQHANALKNDPINPNPAEHTDHTATAHYGEDAIDAANDKKKAATPKRKKT